MNFRFPRFSFVIGAICAVAGGCASGGSDPRGAARQYVLALRDNNIRAAEACVVVHGDSGDQVRDLIVEAAIVPRQLDQICQEKFGHSLPESAGDDQLKAIDDDSLTEALQAIETARAQSLDSNSAVLMANSDAVVTVGIDRRRQPVEKSLMGWRLVFDKGIQGSPEQMMRPGQLGWLLRQQLNIRQDVIADIRGGRLKNIKAVKAEIEAKTAAIGNSLPAGSLGR